MYRSGRITIGIIISLTISILISVQPLNGMIHASQLKGGFDLEMDMNISDASIARIHSEVESNYHSKTVSQAGDVNGDGYDDFLISAPLDDQVIDDSGKTYLFFGKESGWSMEMNFSDADASFIGENLDDQSGYSVSGVGDVNNDGYDDFLIGATMNCDGNTQAGKTYLIFGKSKGWSVDLDLSNADVSFIGEDLTALSGRSVSRGGDINGDGFDDILIGCSNYNGPGEDKGKTYVIFGKASGWTKSGYLKDANASFIGEDNYDYSGWSVSDTGDVNGDGYDDFLIGALGNSDNGGYSGKTYLIFGKAYGWSMDIDLSTADASFIGENPHDESGYSVSGAGDVNGDGFHDFLIGAHQNDEGAPNAGQTYLIFGKASGWPKDLGLSNADASFQGQMIGDKSGCSISDVGNLNGDKYDDFIIGAKGNDEGGSQNGQSYLILGKSIGWSNDVNLSTVDASFIGDNLQEISGYAVSGAEDVNGDGFNDILINAIDLSNEGDGQTYLIAGSGYREPNSIYGLKVKNSFGAEVHTVDKGEEIQVELTGLDSNPAIINRAKVNISFNNLKPSMITISLVETGENSGIYTGNYVIPTRTEYLEKIKFSSFIDQSKYYDVTVDYPFRPSSVSQIKIYSDQSCDTPAPNIDLAEEAYIKVYGTDANIYLQDKAFVNLISDKNSSFRSFLILIETGINTGEYIGSFKVPSWMQFFENITVISVSDLTKTAIFMVHTPVQIRPLLDFYSVVEGEEYKVEYSNFGYETATWSLDLDAPWLNWDEDNHILYGTPYNDHVGSWEVNIKISDGKGHLDSHEFNIIVINTAPNITTENVLIANEGENYNVDYNCTNDGHGDMKWTKFGAYWLDIDMRTGEVYGIPLKEDIGIWNISVSVDDGNGGTNTTNFQLEVFNFNRAPTITNTDITTCKQGEEYYRNYELFDPDIDDIHIWEVTTDADFLSIDQEGILKGIPDNTDIGVWSVNVTVMDMEGLMDSHLFNLLVEDINDPPTWTDFPSNAQIVHGMNFLFDVNAIDNDNDLLEFSISSNPISDITIDEDSGFINWTADVNIFSKEPYKLEVKVSVFDGHVLNNRTFTITVLPTEPPLVELVGPASGMRTSSARTILTWSGSDPEDEPITYDIYVHQTEIYVIVLREEALYISDHTDENITLTGLDPGKTYFWTVIPNDGCSDGLCTSGVMSFRVNYKPTFKTIEDQKISAGTNFKFKISCTDQDTEDIPNLRYSLMDAPEGMTISEETGMIRWTPEDNQVMLHTVTVEVSDGIETNTATFDIEVGKAESSSSSSLFLIIIIVVIVVISLALGIFFFMIKKKQMDEEARRKGDEEREKLKHEKDEHQLSYEDLYGVPAPEKNEEGMTTSELKDYIHEQIEDLEGQE